MKKQPTVLKLTGEYEGVEKTLHAIAKVLHISRMSPIIDSGQGGCHAFITVEGVKK